MSRKLVLNAGLYLQGYHRTLIEVPSRILTLLCTSSKCRASDAITLCSSAPFSPFAAARRNLHARDAAHGNRPLSRSGT